jgi:2-keto-3-deoxy-L-rhamnonate aldolase RhmA
MTDTLKARMARGDRLVGTFVKTPAYEVIEVLGRSKLDFLCLDAEHAPFDRARLDVCLAMGRALGVPMLVRVPSGSPERLLMALDAGATGVVVPHVDSVEKARAVSRAARFGHGGRGFAGSTRWAGFATRPMAEVLAQSVSETIVIAQIEEPEGIDAAEAIAALDGIDALFVGPADLSVSMGLSGPNDPGVLEAMATVGRACKAAGKPLVTWSGGPANREALDEAGVSMFFVASEHAWMLAAANATAEAFR